MATAPAQTWRAQREATSHLSRFPTSKDTTRIPGWPLTQPLSFQDPLGGANTQGDFCEQRSLFSNIPILSERPQRQSTHVVNLPKAPTWPHPLPSMHWPAASFWLPRETTVMCGPGRHRWKGKWPGEDNVRSRELCRENILQAKQSAHTPQQGRGLQGIQEPRFSISVPVRTWPHFPISCCSNNWHPQHHRNCKQLLLLWHNAYRAGIRLGITGCACMCWVTSVVSNSSWPYEP